MGASCSHCLLPLGRLAVQREVSGEMHEFCCYGCCLAYQVHHGETEEPEAAALLIRLGVGGFLSMNIMLFSLLLYSGTFGPGDGWTVTVVHWLLWILATPLVLLLGGPFLQAHGRRHDKAGSAPTCSSASACSAPTATPRTRSYRGAMVCTSTLPPWSSSSSSSGRYLEAQARVRAARSLAPMLAADRALARIFTGGIDTMRAVHAVEAGTVVRILPASAFRSMALSLKDAPTAMRLFSPASPSARRRALVRQCTLAA